MVLDNIKNCEIYYGMHPEFKKAFDFIKKAVEEKYEIGRYEIDGEKMYALVQVYDTLNLDETFYEGHEKYIDIQYVGGNYEAFGVIDRSKATIKDEYNKDKDVAFFEKSEDASYVVANDGDFCIFYPQDIHCPKVAHNNTPVTVNKIVVKVLL